MGTPVMKVIVPAGVVPGQAFIVQTPGGTIQVTCPPNVYGGQQMLVNVPAQQVPLVMAEAVVMSAQPMAAQPMMGQAMSATPTSTTNPTPLPTEEAIKAERALSSAVFALLAASLPVCWFPSGTLGLIAASAYKHKFSRTSAATRTHEWYGRMARWLCNMCVASAVFCFLGCLFSGFIANMGLSNIGPCIELSPFALPHLGVGACDAYSKVLADGTFYSKLVPNDDSCQLIPGEYTAGAQSGSCDDSPVDQAFWDWAGGARGSPFICACGTDASDCGRRSERMCCDAWKHGCAALLGGGIFWAGVSVFQVMVFVADCLVCRRAQALLRMLDERGPS